MRAKLAIVLLITVACLFWVLRGIDPEAVKIAVTEARWWLLAPAIGVYWFTHVLRSWRFMLLANTEQWTVSFWRMFSICGVGFLAIQVVPFRLGELVRPYLLNEQEGMSMGHALAAVVLERLTDFLMLLGLLMLVAFVIELPSALLIGGVDVVTTAQQIVGGLLAVGLVGLGGLVAIGEPAARWVGGKLTWVPAIGPKLQDFLVNFARAPRSLLARPMVGALVLAQSVGIWFFTVIGVWLVMLAFEGIPHDLGAAAVVWTAAISGSIAVPTPGFFGPFEAFVLAALMLWEVNLDAGRTVAVVIHLSQFGFSILLGGYYLIKEGLSLRNIVAASQAAPEA